ncbi:YheE family protein [Paenisporosarcina indica]|uniref:YheE family protein n=1 Tax=Paenisporosarcina indica TaxID=650093 RepID=UPI0009503200|nr:YheE family protein [Paenisporosarcina indica]
MLQHFSFKPMFENKQLPGWTFSFFYKQTRFGGEYQPDGSITWTSGTTPPDEEIVKKMIHELMLFHVYD